MPRIQLLGLFQMALEREGRSYIPDSHAARTCHLEPPPCLQHPDHAHPPACCRSVQCYLHLPGPAVQSFRQFSAATNAGTSRWQQHWERGCAGHPRKPLQPTVSCLGRPMRGMTPLGADLLGLRPLPCGLHPHTLPVSRSLHSQQLQPLAHWKHDRSD